MKSFFLRYTRGITNIPAARTKSSRIPNIDYAGYICSKNVIKCSFVTQPLCETVPSISKRWKSSMPSLYMDDEKLWEGKNSTLSELEKPSDMTSILIEVKDRVGVLCDILRFFWKYDINVRHIESRPAAKTNALGDQRFCFYVDFEGVRGKNQNVDKLISELEDHTARLTLLDDKEVKF